MSDLEQWMRENYPNFSPPLNEVWNAAIASMQGESKPVATIVYDRRTDENGNTYHKSRPQVWPLIADAELLVYPHSTQLFTYPPDAAAEIARLTKELEEARKGAERWNAILHSGAYSPSDFGNPIGFAGRTGQYTKEQLNASVDAYISKHCNAAICQTGGGK